MENKENEKYLELIFELLEDKRIYLIKDINTEKISEILKKNVRYLNGILKSSIGLSIENLIVMYRVQYARELLAIGIDYEKLWDLSGFASSSDMESALESIVV
jgi:AraC-like DNA-binding protein